MELDKLKIDKSRIVKKKQSRFIIFAIVFLVLISLIFYKTEFISFQKEVEETVVSYLYPYQTVTVFNASGYVTALKKASVSSKITGKVVTLNAEEGRFVKKNEILATLENDEAIAVKKQAEAQIEMAERNLIIANEDLKEAERQFIRYKNLYEKGLVPRSSFELYETNFNKARSQKEVIEAQIRSYRAGFEQAMVAIENTIIRAPFDGIILTKNADIGDIVTPIGAAVTAKASVVTMADFSTLYVETDVSESYIEKVRLNQPAIIRLDAFPDKIFKAKVYSIIPTADRTKASVTVKVSFLEKDKHILPDMSAKVSFLSRELSEKENEPFLVVSKKAVLREDSRHYVFVIEKDRVFKKEIEIGRELDDSYVIKAGLSQGSRVVFNPPKGLKNNSKVKIVEK